jgi:peptidoglycan/LPS O-acetylase OafA/YrhL
MLKPQAAHPRTTHHYEILDGLRGVAAVCVVLFHRHYWMPSRHFLDHGYLAVDFFFCLSGFVIAHAYGARLANGMTFRQFVVVRVIRLYPLLVLGAVAGGLVALQGAMRAGQDITGAEWVAIAAALLCLPTVSPVHQSFGFSDNAFPVNGPQWSLFFEICVNFLFAALFKYWTTLLTALLVVASALIVMSFGVAGNHFDDLLLGLPRALLSFGMGVLLSRARAGKTSHTSSAAFFLLSGALIVLFWPDLMPFNDSAYELACILVAFPAIVWFGSKYEPGERTRKICDISGRLSYPLYILHFPILRMMDQVVPHSPAGVLASLLVCVAAAYAASRWYDEPLRQWIMLRSTTRSTPNTMATVTRTESARP